MIENRPTGGAIGGKKDLKINRTVSREFRQDKMPKRKCGSKYASVDTQ